MGNLILYYISSDTAGLLKINGNIAGSTKETLCALSPRTSEVFLEWQPFQSEYMPICACLEFKDGELLKKDIPSSVKVLIYSDRLLEITLDPKKSRLAQFPPHGYFDLPYKKQGEELVLRAYYDGGNIVSIERIMELRLEFISYTEIDLENCKKGIFENGGQTLLYLSDSEKTLLLSHTDKVEVLGIYNAAAELTENALVLTERLPYFASRKRRLMFTQGKFLTEFSPFESDAFDKDEDAAQALMFCVRYGLTADAEKILGDGLPKGTAAHLREFFGEFDRFTLPHISSKCENGTVCIALLKDAGKNISMAKPYFFKVEKGKITNISD